MNVNPVQPLHDDRPVYCGSEVESYINQLLEGEITSTAMIYSAITTQFPGITPEQISDCTNNLLAAMSRKAVGH